MTITLLSDLGTRDASVSIAKAILMRYAPGVQVTDISHDVAQYDLQQAAYLLLSAYGHFPAGTVHVLPVDVFGGDAPRMLLAAHDGHYFIAPDNGLLPLAFGNEMGDTRLCFQFGKPYSFSEWTNSAGKVIESIAQGSTAQYQPSDAKKARRLLQQQAMPLGIDCNILYIDRYGNVALDITKAQFEDHTKGRPFKIRVMRMPDITTISNNYNDVPDGQPLCRFNNAGFLEIALNRESIASLLGFGSYSAGNLRYQTVRIFF